MAVLTVRIHGAQLRCLLLGRSFLLGGWLPVLQGLVPLVSEFRLPVLVLLDLGDALADDLERLADLKVLQILVVVKVVSELEESVDLCLFVILLLLLGLGPSRFAALLRL